MAAPTLLFPPEAGMKIRVPARQDQMGAEKMTRRHDDDSQPSPHRPLRVLCADDDKQLATLLEIALERAGYFVESVHDGQVAFERITADMQFFDLLVTDHRMPRLTGLQLVERLRVAGLAGNVIVHSSHLHQRDTSAYRALAVSAFLAKPVTLSELITAAQQAGGIAP